MKENYVKGDGMHWWKDENSALMKENIIMWKGGEVQWDARLSLRLKIH